MVVCAAWAVHCLLLHARRVSSLRILLYAACSASGACRSCPAAHLQPALWHADSARVDGCVVVGQPCLAADCGHPLLQQRQGLQLDAVLDVYAPAHQALECCRQQGDSGQPGSIPSGSDSWACCTGWSACSCCSSPLLSAVGTGQLGASPALPGCLQVQARRWHSTAFCSVSLCSKRPWQIAEKCH